MITVTVTLSEEEMQVKVSGHADYAEKGKDIVCAGVSAIVQTAVLGLQAIAEKYPRHVKVTVRGENHGGKLDSVSNQASWNS